MFRFFSWTGLYFLVGEWCRVLDRKAEDRCRWREIGTGAPRWGGRPRRADRDVPGHAVRRRPVDLPGGEQAHGNGFGAGPRERGHPADLLRHGAPL